MMQDQIKEKGNIFYSLKIALLDMICDCVKITAYQWMVIMEWGMT